MAIDMKFVLTKLKSLGFEIIETEVGKFVKMSTLDALRFSIIHGASFLNNEVGTTLKGRGEVFIHRAVFQNNCLIYSPGLFGRDENCFIKPGNSFRELKKKFPKVFEGEYKFVYPIELKEDQRSNVEKEYYLKFNELYSKHKKDYLNPSNILLLKIFKRGTNLEPFLEYLTSVYFNRKGYITENQTPWFQQKYTLDGKTINGGIPDFSAFKYDLLSPLSEKGIYSEGMPVQEFGLLFLKGIGKKSKKEVKYELKIGEAKISRSSKPQINKQLTQYSEANLADALFGIIPDETQGFDNFGLLTFNTGIEYNEKNATKQNNNIRKEDNIWLGIYTKILLLSNLEFEDIKKFVNQTNHENKINITSKDLLDCILKVKDDELIKYVLESM